MASLLPQPNPAYLDDNGDPLVGGFVFHYVPGTLVTKSVYQDEAETILASQPVVLDSGGRPGSMYGDGNYRFIVQDANGIQLYDLNTAATIEDSAIGAPIRPALAASSLQLFRDLSGTSAAIAAAVAAVSTLQGAQGPAGPVGATGATGAKGDTGASGAVNIISNANGIALQWTIPSSFVIQFGSGTTDGSGNCDITLPMIFPNAVGGAMVSPFGPLWLAYFSQGNLSVAGFTAYARIAGGGPVNAASFTWIAWGT